MPQQRLQWLDSMRGCAVILMVIFHFCYDLKYFGYVSWDIPNGPLWQPLRYFILSLFLTTVGASLWLQHHNGIRWSSFLQRLLKLSIAASAITFVSIWLFPSAWIYFGILHFIAIASLLVLPFVFKPLLASLCAFIILVLTYGDYLSPRWPFAAVGQYLPPRTEDFVPFFPWLGLVLLGITIIAFIQRFAWDLPNKPIVRYLACIGRYAFPIYLLHQPFFFALLIAFGFLASSLQ